MQVELGSLEAVWILASNPLRRYQTTSLHLLAKDAALRLCRAVSHQDQGPTRPAVKGKTTRPVISRLRRLRAIWHDFAKSWIWNNHRIWRKAKSHLNSIITIQKRRKNVLLRRNNNITTSSEWNLQRLRKYLMKQIIQMALILPTSRTNNSSSVQIGPWRIRLYTEPSASSKFSM